MTCQLRKTNSDWSEASANAPAMRSSFFSFAFQRAQRRIPRIRGIRRCTHFEDFRNPGRRSVSGAIGRIGVSSSAGFTLVELLVVIVILGILLAMMVPAAGMILKKVKIAQARSDAQVVVATMSKYRMEYNRWPKVDEVAEGFPGTSKAWVDIMNPEITTGAGNRDPNNFRQLRFLEMGKGMKIESGEYEGGFGDPWGHSKGRVPYLYAVDHDGDGHVENPDPEKSGEFIRADVIAWSAGPDGDYSTWKDNVGSWE